MHAQQVLQSMLGKALAEGKELPCLPFNITGHAHHL